MDKQQAEAVEVRANEEAREPKKAYKTPEVIVHGKVEKLTLATGGGIPG